MNGPVILDRRRVLTGGGALIVSFSLPDAVAQQPEEQAAQCGYCIAGMMMRAQALLQRNPKPTDEQIRAELQPNLCRCGTHMRILRAVQRAARLMESAALSSTTQGSAR